MARTREARTKVTLDSSNFEKGAKLVVSTSENMARGMKVAFAAAGAAILLAFGAQTVSALGRTIKETYEFGEAMANAGKRAQMAAGQFYLFNASVEKGISLKTAASLIGKNAEVLNRSANLFRDVSLKLWAIGEQIRGFWLGMLERISPVLSKLLDGTLGNALIDAGTWFGDALAHAVGVIYQLAKDGKLWTTIKEGFGIAIEYAGERMLWLAKISYEALKYAFSESFTRGILSAIRGVWDAVKKLAAHLGDSISSAFLGAWVKITEWINTVINAFDALQFRIGQMSAVDLVTNINQRSEGVGNMRKALDRANEATAPKDQAPLLFTLINNLRDIFNGNTFTTSEELSAKIADFGKGLNLTFKKFQSGLATDPAKTFENNTRMNTYGADSLAAIGGGGGVYLGLSVLDVNKRQLAELQQIKGILATKQSAVNVVNQIQAGIHGVSRTQTASPVQPQN